jgi:pyruvate-formate lyase-activating enzyme
MSIGRQGLRVAGLYNGTMLTLSDHRRDYAGLTYIYPVVSRRAGGLSLGINLNVNNACNWACVYCQVEGLTRGGPPPVDLVLLENELECFLERLAHGDFFQREVPPHYRRLVDVAFSGNGEPSSAAEFPAAVALVRRLLEVRGLTPGVRIRLITNGSLLHRPAVQAGIRALGEGEGEVWFKVDRLGAHATLAVNGVRLDPGKALRNLRRCAALAPTWIQTCWFALDGAAPDSAARDAYCEFVGQVAGRIRGIHLYGLARPSQQAAAPRLGVLAESELCEFARYIKKKTGVRTVVSP